MPDYFAVKKSAPSMLTLNQPGGGGFQATLSLWSELTWFGVSLAIWNSSNNFREFCTTNRPGRLFPPFRTSFLLFHIPHQIVTHSSSFPGCASQQFLNLLKVSTKLHDSCTVNGKESLLALHTSIPRLQKQSICIIVFSCSA